jgi:hypothetical protein
VSFGCRVGVDLWLGFVGRQPRWRPSARSRLVADRRASARAECLAVAASGLSGQGYVVSRSHTQGMGAAVVAPTGIRIGVDLVLIDRMTERHAAAILSPAESEALAPESALRPALAWALKEAATKATGSPASDFPRSVRIERGEGGVLVWCGDRCFTAGWLRLGRVLSVWVRELPDTTSAVPLCNLFPLSAVY